MRHSKHVVRVVLVLVLLVATVSIARTFVVPKSYGVYGPYRYEAVPELMARPIRHHGSESCKGCHDFQWGLRETGESHKKVGCEVCHAPLAGHVADGKRIAPMPVNKAWQSCARCHRRLDGRPAWHRQVTLDAKHLRGERLEGAVCLKCHDPHSTQAPET